MSTHFLQIEKSVSEQDNMIVFEEIVRWYNNNEVVPTLEAMQNTMEFYHNKGIDMSNLGCTLPYICLHKSTNSEFYRFC